MVLESRGIVLHVSICSENKGADHLCGYRAADLHLCFPICKNRFTHDAAHMLTDRNDPFYNLRVLELCVYMYFRDFASAINDIRDSVYEL